MYTEYWDQGLAILCVVYEDSYGRPATQEYAQSYARSYGFMFTTTYDPTYQLDAYAVSDTVPMNMFIDLSTMQILSVQHGYDGMSLRNEIQTYLSRITR